MDGRVRMRQDVRRSVLVRRPPLHRTLPPSHLILPSPLPSLSRARNDLSVRSDSVGGVAGSEAEEVHGQGPDVQVDLWEG